VLKLFPGWILSEGEGRYSTRRFLFLAHRFVPPMFPFHENLLGVPRCLPCVVLAKTGKFLPLTEATVAERRQAATRC